MSRTADHDPVCNERDGVLAIEARVRDLDGSAVRRVLPSARQRMVGPFAFFDHFGPTVYSPGDGLKVRPHPHIGLATVTWLFDGEIMHRDSLGCVQPIRPGAVNLMTAGRGIVHSERTALDLDDDLGLHGLQLWLALPDGQEECEPAFEHVGADELPAIEQDGVRGRLVIGEAWGLRSPVTTLSPTLFAECRLDAGASMSLPGGCTDIAVYVVDGELRIGDERYGSGVMAVLHGCERTLATDAGCLVAIIGGEPVGERFIWWNFVSSSRERIEVAKSDWRDGRFAKVPGDDEFTPLPER